MGSGTEAHGTERKQRKRSRKKRGNRPRRFMRDQSSDAFMRRLETHEHLIVQRGGFPKNKASEAVVLPSPKTKEPIARWLRVELKSLRNSEKKIGAAPVFRGE